MIYISEVSCLVSWSLERQKIEWSLWKGCLRIQRRCRSSSSFEGIVWHGMCGEIHERFFFFVCSLIAEKLSLNFYYKHVTKKNGNFKLVFFNSTDHLTITGRPFTHIDGMVGLPTPTRLLPFSNIESIYLPASYFEFFPGLFLWALAIISKSDQARVSRWSNAPRSIPPLPLKI